MWKSENQLYANVIKWEIGKSRITYLGHVVSGEGIAVDFEKIKAMQDWPHPKNLKQLRGFLGLTGYYRRFIWQYAHMAAPLTQQLGKESFHWTPEATIAVETLKAAMLTTPVLAIPNFSIPFVIEADALGYGLGAVLTQNKHPRA